MQGLFDPARHEPLTATPWSEEAARAAIVRIAASALAEFEPGRGAWRAHPLDEPESADLRWYRLYDGSAGVVWALRDLRAQGALPAGNDFADLVRRLPELARAAAAQEMHGSASYPMGESGALLLAWAVTRERAFADRLFDVVQGNLRNPAREPLWGNPGTMLAAIHMAQASGEVRWMFLVQRAAAALRDEMQTDPESGTWIWEQDLYGRRIRYLGAGHGFAGNVYAIVRGADCLDALTVATTWERALGTLAATALVADIDGVRCANWHPMIDAARVAGRLPLVQDCHGAPGIVCRLAAAPRSAEWDELLLAAGELTWIAGPLVKGASLCHGTSGSAMACLKLWRRFADPRWLDRARRLAMHAIEQVERHRAQYGMGRHSLWTGDLGAACVLWNCITRDDRFATLDHF